MATELILLISFLFILQIGTLALAIYNYTKLRIVTESKQRVFIPNIPQMPEEEEMPQNPISSLYSEHLNRSFNKINGLDDE